MKPDWELIRKDFPILELKIRGKPLVYLDNAATTQKPRAVIERISQYYLKENANIHRGVHTLSEVATLAFETARKKVAQFMSAPSEREVIFTRGTTESINLLATVFAGTRVKAGDEILLSALEHHSNIVPWQLLAQKVGAVIKVIPINQRGELQLESLQDLLTTKTKIVAINHVSNALGTINPIKKITAMAKSVGALTVIDGAQAIAHLPVHVQELGCDFYAFSSHKLFGPTGVGVLWGRESLLKSFPPFQGGGDMIRTVTFEKSTYADLPHYFEAGTPDISGVIGLGEAIDYVNRVGLAAIANREAELLTLATAELQKISGLRIVGQAEQKASVLSFVLEGIHPHDIGTIVDQEGVAIRTGHHCAQPVMQFFKVPATARASFSFYNNEQDIVSLVMALDKVKRMFA